MLRSLTEVQKGAIFYLITLGMAVLVALFGPTVPMPRARHRGVGADEAARDAKGRSSRSAEVSACGLYRPGG